MIPTHACTTVETMSACAEQLVDASMESVPLESHTNLPHVDVVVAVVVGVVVGVVVDEVVAVVVAVVVRVLVAVVLGVVVAVVVPVVRSQFAKSPACCQCGKVEQQSVWLHVSARFRDCVNRCKPMGRSNDGASVCACGGGGGG